MNDQNPKLDDKEHGGRKAAWLRRHVNYQDEECLIFPFALHKDGYGLVGYNWKVLYAHRFMCQLAHGEPPTPEYQAAHSCNRGNEGCVNPGHLSWKTPGENHKEAKWHPKIKVGPEDAKAIRDLKGLENVTVTAERYGLAEVTVRQIQSGRIWSGKGRAARLFTDAEIHRIRAIKGTAYQTKKLQKIADDFGVSYGSVYKIMNRQTWLHVPEYTQTSC